ncbi:2-dehydro-3-deoxygalactonokinase [Lichenicoccus sp.]|uniref:2-dehydro-3-deoxygalactonokinase n=1 Tax=Lichenicoccus sp. TaxID=2781899 RepID=UPI003D0E2D4B
MPTPTAIPTNLIALDWGTSSLRAWRLSRSGRVLDARSKAWGIMHLPDGGFAAAFATITEGWRAPGTAALACGMVGSRQGWHEVAYLPTPAGLPELAGALHAFPTADGGTLHLVPGLLDGAPDVMRGEETQAIGAAPLLGDDALLVMPGTHSKWSRLQHGRVVSFRTMMTGELFALLRRHSILGRDDGTADAETRDLAFTRGVQDAQAQGGFARLFATRALSLTGGLAPGCAADYLSGLLIGEELRLAADARSPGTRVALTGDPALCDRYAGAFAALDLTVPERLGDTALAGLRHIAHHAGLLDAPDGA